MESANTIEENDISAGAALTQDISRAAEAEKLLSNPLLSQAFEEIDSDLVARWKNTAVSDRETRESLWREANLLKSLKSKIESHIETGKLAKVKALSLMQWAKSLF